MKNYTLLLLLSLLPIVFLSSCKKINPKNLEETVVVANRGGQSVSFVDAKTDQVISTLTIPGSEPMYVIYSPSQDKVYVGDRAQNQVHIIDPDTKMVVGSISVGNGVFHMWLDGYGNTLWVNNDLDQTTSVIDLATNTVIQTINIGVRPHDVFVTEDGTRAYVSTLEPEVTSPDSVILYDAKTYQRLGARAVGKDPHLFHLQKRDRLVVPNQSGTIFILDGSSLNLIQQITAPGAHGIFSRRPGNVYITNISGAELYNLNGNSNQLIGNPVATPVATPHNAAVDALNKKLYITHSGATADKLTVYDLNGANISLKTTLTLGTNPFGIYYYVR